MKPLNEIQAYHQYIRNRNLHLILTTQSCIQAVWNYICTKHYVGIRLLEVYNIKDFANKCEEMSVLFWDSNGSTCVPTPQAFEEYAQAAERNEPFCAAVLYTDYTDRRLFWKSFLLDLDKHIPAGYEVSENIVVNGDKDLYPYYIYGKNKRGNNRRMALIPDELFGLGDAMILVPLIQYIVDQAGPGNVDILYSSNKVYQIFSNAVKECSHLRIAPCRDISRIFSRTYGQTGEYEKIIHFLELHIRNRARNMHEFDYWKQALQIELPSEELIERYHYSFGLDETAICRQIYSLRQSFQWIITTQFFTKQRDSRNWTYEQAEKFIALCNRYDIAVINVAPCPWELSYQLDASETPIAQMFSVLNLVDLHVGIDSCFGHMAGLLQKNSLTLWNDDPVDNSIYHRSYRVMRNNYSLVSVNNPLTAEIVLNYTLRILHRQLIPQTQYSWKSMQERMDSTIF